jgi:predicted nucleic acid-binding Zn ribbon protein
VSGCPRCGDPVERGQLVCTSCGARLALGQRRPPATLALVALLVVVVLGAGAFGFAVSEITSDDPEDEVTVAEQPAPAAGGGEPQRAARSDAPEAKAPSTRAGDGVRQEPRRSLLLEWPEDLTAHTVVLVTTSDREAAGRLARQAARSGIEAGLLRSDDYNLGSGLWIVFAGRFDTPEGAARQASDLAERFPGAYPQLVEPRSQ